MLCLDKGNVVQEKDARFFDPAQFFHRAFRGFGSITSPVESPGAAEDAVPRATPAELNGGTRIKHTDKVLSPVPEQVSGRQYGIETLHEGWPGSLSGDRLNPWYPVQIRPVLLGRLQDGNDHRFAFPFEYGVDAPLSMLQDLGPGKRGAVAPDHDESIAAEVPGSPFARSMISGTLAR